MGISNELNFTASGEMDNGFTWKYHTELDPVDGGAASNDDTAIVIGMGDQVLLAYMTLKADYLQS